MKDDSQQRSTKGSGEERSEPHPIVVNEALFRGLTLHSADIISVLDEQGRLLYNSPATERINGFTADDLAHIDTFELIHPEDRDRVRAVFGRVLASPGSVHTVEYRYRTKEGGWLWMEAVASNQLDEPAVRGVVANCRDISERVRAREERERMQEQLLQAQKLESLGRLAGGIAHNFNNLLTVIRSGADLLTETARTEEKANVLVDRIRDSADRAAELTYLLLAYAGRGSFSRQRVCVADLLTSLRPLLELTANANQLAIAVDTPLFVEADPRQLKQMLLNLVQNAVESATREVSVRVSASRERLKAPRIARCLHAENLRPGPHVAFVVEDDGPGISEEDGTRLFDPFFSTKAEGRGLGLAAVQGIVRAHGAGLAVENRPGGGTRIGIYFREVDAAHSTMPRHPRATTQGATVLLIEDQPDVAIVTSLILESTGFRALVAHGGQEGLELLSSHAEDIEVLILDLVMPGMSGAETYRKLRKSAPTLPVLFYSGTEPDSIREHLDEPATGFLQKPFGPEALAAELTKLLEVKRTSTELA